MSFKKIRELEKKDVSLWTVLDRLRGEASASKFTQVQQQELESCIAQLQPTKQEVKRIITTHKTTRDVVAAEKDINDVFDSINNHAMSAREILSVCSVLIHGLKLRGNLAASSRARD